MRAQVTAVVLTMNEEDKLTECLTSLKFADQLLVVDAGSTDKTLAIAKEFAAEVKTRPMADGFAAQRNFALSCVTTPWVLFVDADERITAELAQEVLQVLETSEQNAFSLIRRNRLFGQVVNHGAYRPDYNIRLFPTQSVVWEGLVHEVPKTSLPVRRLQGGMLHDTNPSWEKYWDKFNQYTTLMAQRNFEKGKKARFMRDIVIRPWFAFWKAYVFQKGFLDGRLGFIMAVLHGVYTMMKYVKLAALQRKG